MRTSKFILSALVTVVLGTLGGCLAAPEPTYTTTAVRRNADGTQAVTHGSITLSQQLRDNEARAARGRNQYPGLGTAADAITRDGACGGASMWLYDQPGNTGNMLCFEDQGIEDLATWIHSCTYSGPFPLCSTWNQYVKSYWAGTDGGYFESKTDVCGGTKFGCAPFAPDAKSASLSACEAASTRYLNLDDACCPSGDTLCATTCVNTSTSPTNCGSCGYTCPSNLPSCNAGVCGCPAGETACGGTCKSTATDPNNCGGCGHTCGSNQTCSGGTCVCPAPYTLCNGQCVNTNSDNLNCGACNTGCGAGTACCLNPVTKQPQCTPDQEWYCCGPAGVNCGLSIPATDPISYCQEPGEPAMNSCTNPATGQCALPMGYQKCP